MDMLARLISNQVGEHSGDLNLTLFLTMCLVSQASSTSGRLCRERKEQGFSFPPKHLEYHIIHIIGVHKDPKSLVTFV